LKDLLPQFAPSGLETDLTGASFVRPFKALDFLSSIFSESHHAWCLAARRVWAGSATQTPNVKGPDFFIPSPRKTEANAQVEWSCNRETTLIPDDDLP